jgi:hypothetical protein
MSSARRALALAVALAALLVAPAAASAATVSATQPCVLDGASDLGVTSSGWAPGASLNFALDGRSVGTGLADAHGLFSNAASPFQAPLLGGRHRVRQFTLTAADTTGQQADARVKVVHRTVDVPARARPAKRVRYRAYGFPRGKKLFLHVRRGTHTLGRFGIGRAHGACGVASRRLRYMPLRHWNTGTYDFWFGNRRHFKRSRALFGYRIRIYKSAL